MLQATIISENPFCFEDYMKVLAMDDIVLSITPEEILGVWGFYRKGKSTTLFSIEQQADGFALSMDGLASYDDYKLFPYLIDTLSLCLNDEHYESDGQSAYAIFNEDWIEYEIGEEIAYLKCILSIGSKYYISLPIEGDCPYVSTDVLNEYGVTIYSSTPRIYGYIQYLMRNGLIPSDAEQEIPDISEDAEFDVPQHIAIGRVRSWQTDGSDTYETYSKEDIAQLLSVAQNYEEGKHVEGVVLNDIGTIYEYGIGVEKDISMAIRWFKEAIENGDNLYAPTSLGDIYRRGDEDGTPNLRLAFEAYAISIDPYAWYRIGQAYEEGWICESDMKKAYEYYDKAVAVGHHLAIKRMEAEEETY